MKALNSYMWPGNTRELKNVIDKLLSLPQGKFTIDDLPGHIQENRNIFGDPERPTVSESQLQYAKKHGLQALIHEVEKSIVSSSMKSLHKRKKDCMNLLKISTSKFYAIEKRGLDG